MNVYVTDLLLHKLLSIYCFCSILYIPFIDYDFPINCDDDSINYIFSVLYDSSIDYDCSIYC